jgi:hypothetical protein
MDNNEVKLTQLDAKDIPRYSYDEKHRANRVVIVGENYIPPEKMEAATKIEYITVKEYEQIQIPVIVKEYQTIEVPTTIFLPQIVEIEKINNVFITEYKEIEKTVIVKEFEVITVEKPIIQIQEKIVYVDRLNMKMLYIMQGITLALILLSKFLK